MLIKINCLEHHEEERALVISIAKPPDNETNSQTPDQLIRKSSGGSYG